jgi:hypothetical protein
MVGTSLASAFLTSSLYPNQYGNWTAPVRTAMGGRSRPFCVQRQHSQRTFASLRLVPVSFFPTHRLSQAGDKFTTLREVGDLRAPLFQYNPLAIFTLL